MSHTEHESHPPLYLRCAVLTVSDSRKSSEDATGRAIRDALETAGHQVVRVDLIRDDVAAIGEVVKEWLADDIVQMVVVDGGTGIGPRDVTPEAVRPLLDKELPGFGELFRTLSFEQIGPAAYLSRALAGTARGKPVFLLPGSTAAAALAMERLILPQMSHLWRMLHPGT